MPLGRVLVVLDTDFVRGTSAANIFWPPSV